MKPPTPQPADDLSACIAAILEIEGAPSLPPVEWHSWLAAHNAALFRSQTLPGSGYWIGELDDDRFAVMFGSPPDVVWDPRGALDADVVPRAALILYMLDPVLDEGSLGNEGELAAGEVAGVFLAPRTAAPCVSVPEAEARPGHGLVGDRYYYGTGHFSLPGKPGQDLTLVAMEALDELFEETGVRLDPAEARRNVATRGIDVNALVGRRFAIGEVECLGRRWCEPCAHLQKLTRPGVLRGLVHRGGLRADILTRGWIRPGDPVRVVE